MSKETNATLLRAYRSAVEAGQYTIADMLEDVILEKMDKSGISVPVMRGITVGDKFPEPPWRVTCGTDVMPLGAKMECTGSAHLSKETTV